MFPGSSKGGGQTFAFPDVCKVPAPPAPFAPVPTPNIKMAQTASKGKVKGVKMAGKAVEKLQKSSGDEAGTLKGTQISPSKTVVKILGAVETHEKNAQKLLGKAGKAKNYKAAKKIHAQAVKQDKAHKLKLKKDVKALVDFAKSSKDNKLLKIAIQLRTGLGIA